MNEARCACDRKVCGGACKEQRVKDKRKGTCPALYYPQSKRPFKDTHRRHSEDE